MSFQRPTLSELVSRISADLETRLDIVGAVLRNSFTKLFAYAVAGVAHTLHGHLSWLAKQIIYDTADSDIVLRWGSIWDLDRTPATFAEGEVTFTGENGTLIEAETKLVSSDGIQFKTTEDVTIAGGEAVAGIRSLSAGEAGNAEAGTLLSLLSPVAGVEGEAEVTTEVAGGTDEETIEDYRARLIARIQRPPLGGASADYELWAKEVAGVTRVWVEPLYNGAGTVGIFFVRDNDDSIFPSEEEVDAVSAYIDTKRPIPAKHYVYAPTAYSVDIELVLDPDADADVQAAVEEELNDLFTREGEPGGLIYLSHIQEAISIAAGEVDHTLVSPSANVEPPTGRLPILGDVTYL